MPCNNDQHHNVEKQVALPIVLDRDVIVFFNLFNVAVVVNTKPKKVSKELQETAVDNVVEKGFHVDLETTPSSSSTYRVANPYP